MKYPNIDIDQLKRDKLKSPEERMEWLYSALQFARAKKKIVKTHNNKCK